MDIKITIPNGKHCDRDGTICPMLEQAYCSCGLFPEHNPDIDEELDLLFRTEECIQRTPLMKVIGGWVIADVMTKAKEMGEDLSVDECVSILDYCEENFDASVGITWDNIEGAIEQIA